MTPPRNWKPEKWPVVLIASWVVVCAAVAVYYYNSGQLGWSLYWTGLTIFSAFSLRASVKSYRRQCETERRIKQMWLEHEQRMDVYRQQIADIRDRWES